MIVTCGTCFLASWVRTAHRNSWKLLSPSVKGRKTKLLSRTGASNPSVSSKGDSDSNLARNASQSSTSSSRHRVTFDGCCHFVDQRVRRRSPRRRFPGPSESLVLVVYAQHYSLGTPKSLDSRERSARSFGSFYSGASQLSMHSLRTNSTVRKSKKAHPT